MVIEILKAMYKKGISVTIKPAPTDTAVLEITMCMNHHSMIRYLNIDASSCTYSDEAQYLRDVLVCMYGEFLVGYHKKKGFADHLTYCGERGDIFEETGETAYGRTEKQET